MKDTRIRINDPDEAIVRAAQLARIGQADLSPLASIALWKMAPTLVQDIVAREVAARLGEAWEFKEMRDWVSICARRPTRENDRGQCDTCEGLGSLPSIINGRQCFPLCKECAPISSLNRLALFTHRATGMEFSLCPGRAALRCLIHKAFGPNAADLITSITIPDHVVRGLGPCRCDSAITPLLVARWPVTHGQSWSTSQRHGVGNTSSMYEDMNTARQDLPVTGASHADVMEWLSYSPGLRLPAAAEWEHFARAGTTTRFYWGEEMDDSHCWHAGNSHGERPVNIPGSRMAAYHNEMISNGQYRPRPHAPAEHDAAGKFNAFGLVDVIGNVNEWCADGESAGLSAYDARDYMHMFAPRHPEAHNRGGGQRSLGFRPMADVPGLSQ